MVKGTTLRLHHRIDLKQQYLSPFKFFYMSLDRPTSRAIRLSDDDVWLVPRFIGLTLTQETNFR